MKANMSTIKYSIVMTVYNSEKFLEESISSVINQTYPNYELVLVDDGSTDISGVICDRYKTEYPDKISVVHQQNQGQILARINGLKLVTGDYVCYVDSDDILDLQMLYEINSVIQSNRVDMVLWGYNMINEDGTKYFRDVKHEFETGNIDKAQLIDCWVENGSLNPLWRKMIRRELLDKWNSIDNYNIIRGGDLYLSIPVMECAKSYYYIAKKLLLYRLNSNSITSKFKRNVWKTNSIVRQCEYDFLVRNGLSDEKKVKFFSRYYNEIWQVLLEIHRASIPSLEKEQIYNEILTYKLSKEGEKFLDKRIGKGLNKKVRTLYNKKYNILKLLLTCDCCKLNIKRKIRNVLVYLICAR